LRLVSPEALRPRFGRKSYSPPSKVVKDMAPAPKGEISVIRALAQWRRIELAGCKCRRHSLQPISNPPANDLGSFEVTQGPKDRWAFKTSGLRNVELTGPYMHERLDNDARRDRRISR
jgi:hypothetical protein